MNTPPDRTRLLACLPSFGVLAVSLAASVPASGQDFDTPQTRLRPIGAPSAVDRYGAVDRYSAVDPYRSSGAMTGNEASRNVFASAGYATPTTSSNIRQTAMQFGFPTDASPAPPPQISPPQTLSPQNLPPQTLAPQTAPTQFTPPPGFNTVPQFNAPPPRTLPTAPLAQAPPTSRTQAPIPSSSDMTPIAPPQLSSGGFATVSNCANVTGPSTYLAASGIGCGQTGFVAPTTYAPTIVSPPPTGYPAPNPATLVPLNPSSVIAAPTLPVVPPNAAPVGPLISFGQSANPVQVGPGLFGQPKAYVPGQGLRNWLRYFTP